MICSKCGAELTNDSKYCSFCGHKVECAPIFPADEVHASFTKEAPISHTELESEKTFSDKIKKKCADCWSNLSIYGKVATVSVIFLLLLSVYAVLKSKSVAIAISILQLSLAAVSLLMHNGTIKHERKNSWLKWASLALAVLLSIPNIKSYSQVVETPVNTPLPTSYSHDSEMVISEPTEPPVLETFSIAKGTEYAYMTDEWNVYIATAISDEIISIANWNKFKSNSKTLEHEYEVGAFKINDRENGFAWVDDEHTAFVLTFKDRNKSDFKKGATATFTINISDSDANKGSNYSEDIACFSYKNDDWHLYRAIPLTDTLSKVETWYRTFSTGKFLFAYDWGLIDTLGESTDFEWTDDERTSFSITMNDKANSSYWEEDSLTVFTLESEDYTHFDVKSYLGKWEIGEGGAAIPASAYDFDAENYQDVRADLTHAGFTNITEKALYDIIWGWTDEGEVESVSVDGRTDYSKGEIFSLDVPIIITYHLWEKDDPSNIALSKDSESYEKANYLDGKKEFEEMGFSSIELIEKSTEDNSHAEGEVSSVRISGYSFDSGDTFKPGSTVRIEYYTIIEPKPVYYSTNVIENAKKGNSGVYSYKSTGGTYDNYWIIDFDEGYVYFFADGNGDITCDRTAIVSGDLNDVVIITYHDGEYVWSYGLHFKWQNQPDHLVLQDETGFTYDYYPTDLSKALSLRESKTIYDY